MGCLFEVGVVNHITWVVVLISVASGVEVSAIYVAIVSLIATCCVCTLGFCLLKIDQLWPRYSSSIADERIEFKRACRAIVVVVVMHVMANSGGLFFLGLFWWRLAQATILFTNLVNLIISPRLSGRFKDGDETGFQQVLRKGCLIVFAINIPVLIVIALASPIILQLMGSQYVPYWPILSLLAIGQAINVVAGLAPTVLCMTGLERLWSKVSFYNATFAIALTVALSYYFGAIGAAVGASVYQASQSWLAAITVKIQHGYWTIPPLPWMAMRRMVGRSG